MSDRWVLEWSKKQNSFHVQEVGNMIESNLNKLLNNHSSDYITLGIGPRSEIDKLADRYRSYLKNRISRHSKEDRAGH